MLLALFIRLSKFGFGYIDSSSSVLGLFVCFPISLPISHGAFLNPRELVQRLNPGEMFPYTNSSSNSPHVLESSVIIH